MISKEAYGPTVQSMWKGIPPEQVLEASRSWRENNFAEIKDVVSAEWLRWFAVTVYRDLWEVAEVQNIAATVKDGRPGPGQRLRRVDPGRPKTPENMVSKMTGVYDRYGLWTLGERLAEDLAPLVATVLGKSVRYDRIYFLLYGLDDYISPHDDNQTGPRVNVQLPICVNGLAGLRVHQGDWVTHVDRAGTLRFLGPGVWHEVLPLIGEHGAMRLNVTLRYWLE